MNAYDRERKDKAQLESELRAKDQELQKLKKELEAARCLNTNNANQQTLVELFSDQRKVEAELEDLRQSFDEASIPAGFDEDMHIDWEAVNAYKAATIPAPASDDGDTIPISKDDAEMLGQGLSAANDVNATATEHPDTTVDEELLEMALELESAKREKRQLFKDLRADLPRSTDADSSFHLENSTNLDTRGQEQSHSSFTTSTMSLASPPKTFYNDLSKALKSSTHRAETAELAIHALKVDLCALGFSTPDQSPITNIVDDLRAHFRQARLDLERVLPGETVSGLEEPAKVLPEAISKLQLLSRRVEEREAELRSMHEQQRTLKGNFECGLRAAESANQRIKELEDAVEEGADDLLNMRMKLQANEKDSAEKDHTITSLIAALEKYRDDVARLERLVVQLEHEQSFRLQEARDESEQKIEELEAKVAAEETGRRKAEESAIARLDKISALRAALDAANDDASSLQVQLSALEAQKAESETALKQSETKEDQHELAIQNLNTRVSTLSTALATSQSETTRLDRLVAKLRSRLAISEETSIHAVEDLWQEIVRGVNKSSEIRKRHVRGCKVRGANWKMEDEDEEAEANGGGGRPSHGGEREPMTPVSLVRFQDVETETDVNEEGEVEGRVEMGRGRRSRSASVTRPRCLATEMRMTTKKKGRGRRSRDSGIGMECLAEEDEDEAEAGVGDEGLDPETALSSDPVLPSSSSECGFDIHEDASETALLP